MKQQIIRLLARKEEIKTIKGIFKKFESHMPTMKIASKKIGEFSDRAVVSIKINESNHTKLVEIFLMNGLKVLAIDDYNKKLIDSIKEKLQEDLIDKEAEKTREDIKLTQLPISEDKLNEFAELGDYESIKKVSKDIINFSENFVGKISNLLTTAVSNAIDNEVMAALEGKEQTLQSINNLLLIASDQTLRSFHKKDLRLRAGQSAIELCFQHISLLTELIKIANINKIPNEISILAAVKFAEVVLEDVEFFEKELEFAIKKLNTKWLEIAYDVAENTLPAENKKCYKALIKYLSENQLS